VNIYKVINKKELIPMNSETMKDKELPNKDELGPVEAIEDQLILSEITGGGAGTVIVSGVAGGTVCYAATMATHQSTKNVGIATGVGAVGTGALVATGTAIKNQLKHKPVVPEGVKLAAQAAGHVPL
jgi:hypothetical protein